MHGIQLMHYTNSISLSLSLNATLYLHTKMLHPRYEEDVKMTSSTVSKQHLTLTTFSYINKEDGVGPM